MMALRSHRAFVPKTAVSGVSGHAPEWETNPTRRTLFRTITNGTFANATEEL